MSDSHGGIWIDIEDIGDSGLDIEYIKDPSFFDFKGKDFKIVKDVTIKGTINRFDNDIYLNGRVSTTLEYICSRCLNIFTEEIGTEFSAEYLPESEGITKEEVELIASDLNSYYYKGEGIDILPPIIDQILLSISLKPLCNENCKGLCPHCGQNLNIAKCSCKEDDIDVRLAVLKKIKL